MRHQRDTRHHRPGNFSQWQIKPFRTGEALKNFSNIPVRLPHWQPAGSLFAQRRSRNRPLIPDTTIAIGINRRPALFKLHTRHFHRRTIAQCPRLHIDPVAVRVLFPTEIHAVVIQVQTVHCRIIGNMRGLFFIDLRRHRKRTAIDDETALDRAQPGFHQL